MANVGKRTRSGRAKLEPKWCVSLTPDQQLKQHGRSICFRVADVNTGGFQFYCIPFHFDRQPENQKKQSPLPTGILPFVENGEIPWLSTFAAVGSSLFCFGGIKKVSYSGELPTSAFYRYDYGTTALSRGFWYTLSSFDMIRARCQPQIIALPGKLLVMCGLWKYLEDGSSSAEVFDPYSNSTSPVASLPNELQASPFVVPAALRSANQILVASIVSNAAFVCDLSTLEWVDQSDQIVFGNGTISNLQKVRGEAAVVRDTILCWFHFRGNLLRAYDLKLKMWFERPIIGLKKVGKLSPHVDDNDFSLLPFDYDHVCLLWFDHSPYAPHTCYSVLHCIKVLVSIECAGVRPTFKASVISFRSYALKNQPRFIEAVVLDDTSTAGEGSTSSEFGEERSGLSN